MFSINKDLLLMTGVISVLFLGFIRLIVVHPFYRELVEGNLVIEFTLIPESSFIPQVAKHRLSFKYCITNSTAQSSYLFLSLEFDYFPLCISISLLNNCRGWNETVVRVT